MPEEANWTHDSWRANSVDHSTEEQTQGIHCTLEHFKSCKVEAGIIVQGAEILPAMLAS